MTLNEALSQLEKTGFLVLKNSEQYLNLDIQKFFKNDFKRLSIKRGEFNKQPYTTIEVMER